MIPAVSIYCLLLYPRGLPGSTSGEEHAANAGDLRDAGAIPGM